MVKTIGQLYLETRRALMTQEDSQDAGLIARYLLCSVLDKTQEQVIAESDRYVQEDTCMKVSQLVTRILSGEPLAYVLGQWEFYGMNLIVSPHVLIPRDDTCAVTDLAIRQSLFLDTNAIASRVKDAKVTLADISREAMQVAKKNIALQKLSGRVSCIQADALKPPALFLGKFDLIVSNPPYITTREMQELPKSVGEYEPCLALHGGDDGLMFYRAIADYYRAALKPGGFLCFEFGMGQGDDVCNILEENGFTVLERTRDYNDRERAVLARYNRKDA